ncbi:MAG: hypothetical protein ABFD84_13450, partial [Candidatus Polarisedimenticolia bacterium]
MSRAAVVAFVVACAASAMFAGSARSAFAAPAAPAAPDCAKAKPQRRAFFVQHRPLAEAAQLVESQLGPCG